MSAMSVSEGPIYKRLEVGQAFVSGRACTKQRGQLGRRAGWIAWMPIEMTTMRRVQAPIRAGA
jgi:hypothetical protein